MQSALQVPLKFSLLCILGWYFAPQSIISGYNSEDFKYTPRKVQFKTHRRYYIIYEKSYIINSF